MSHSLVLFAAFSLNGELMMDSLGQEIAFRNVDAEDGIGMIPFALGEVNHLHSSYVFSLMKKKFSLQGVKINYMLCT